MPICLAGDLQDLTAVYMGWLARNRGVEVLQLPEASLGADWAFQGEDPGGPGRLVVGGRAFGHDQPLGMFVRLSPQPPLPSGLDLPALERDLFVAERRGALQHLLNSWPGQVANRPRAGRSNGSKPYQMRRLAGSGFAVPRWIVSNEVDDILSFAAACPNGVVYKSCSGLRSHVRRLDGRVIEHLREGTTPVVVQEFVPGRELRIHTVRDEVFATEVVSAGVDYRFEAEGNVFRAGSVPEDIADLCCRVAREEDLIIAGFDFRVTPDGDWYCLELNPVPTFLPYEMSTGQPIGASLVRILTDRPSGDR